MQTTEGERGSSKNIWGEAGSFNVLLRGTKNRAGLSGDFLQIAYRHLPMVDSNIQLANCLPTQPRNLSSTKALMGQRFNRWSPLYRE
jgi:hypothetical protein